LRRGSERDRDRGDARDQQQSEQTHEDLHELSRGSWLGGRAGRAIHQAAESGTFYRASVTASPEPRAPSPCTGRVSSSAMTPFVPRASLRGGHRMTLYSWGTPVSFPQVPPPARRYFDVARETRVVADCHWHANRWAHPTLIALHGLNGSSDAHYMRGMAAKAFARGVNVVRLNQRNCGDTEHLSEGLFPSGLTADAAHPVQELTHVDGLRAIAVAGYSLGGNLALKLAGEYGPNAPAELIAVAAVSPIVEIAECTRALERRENWLYEWNFVRDLKRRMRRKEQR